MPIQVTLSASWRDSAGRFASHPVAGAVDAQLPALGRDLVQKLTGATPVRTGEMKANWTQVYVPSRKQIRIANRKGYWPYPTFGTSKQQANPELQAVINSAPRDLSVTGDKIGRQILAALTGEA